MGATLKSRRLFFALWPTDALRLAIDEAARPLLEGRQARPIPAENFHITLAFLGSVREALLAPIKDAAASVLCPPFDLRLDRVETWRRAELLCVVPSTASSELALLVEQLWTNLLQLQFEPDHKEFKPHVTLAREWRGPRVGQACGPFVWPTSEVVLVESHTEPRGSQYHTLEQWPLRSSASA